MEELKEGWRRVKLGEIGDIVTGKTPSTKEKDNFGAEYLFLTPKDMKGEKNIYLTERNVSKIGVLKLLKQIIKPDSVCVSCIGSDMGKVCIVKKKCITNQQINSITNIKNSFDYRYIYYKLSKMKEFFHNMAGGTTMPIINKTLFSEIIIEVPPLETQEKIASILSALDDKIEINNEMNKTLEEMAQTLFKRWFIDFDFPNENGEPYRSSGGKMVDSELGEIPEGWRIDSIYELADYINGTSFKSNEYGDHGLPVIKIVELKNGITDSTKFCISDKDKKFHLKNGEILFSWSGNPQTSIDIFIWSLGKAILNQHTFKVVPYNQKMDSYIYFLLKYLKPKFCDIASNKQTTGLGHVTVKDLKNLKIAFNYEEIYKFCEISQNIFKKLLDNQQEIQSLTEIRDTLLPKLMSGEIEV